MPLTLTEYSGCAYVSGHALNPLVPQEPPLASQAITIGSSVSTNTLNGATRLVRIQADAGCFIMFTSSGSTVIPTSTNSQRMVANGPPEYRGVNGSMRVCTLST